MENDKSIRKIAWVLMTIFLLSLIPIVLISPSVYPFSDDFTLGSYTYHAFMDEHSVFAMIRNALSNTYDVYTEWQGTYTTIFLMSMEPGTFGYRFYHITPVFITVTFCLALFYLLYVLIRRIAKGTYHVLLIFFALLALLILQNIPDQAQAFCWWTGAVHYMTGDALWFLYYGKLLTVLKSTSDGKKVGIVHHIILALLGFLTGGVNNITIVWAFMLLCTTEAVLFYFRTPFSVRKVTLPSEILLFGGILLNILCPGAQNRLALFGGNSNGIIATILKSFVAGSIYSVKWMNGTILLLILLLLPFAMIVADNLFDSGFTFPMPGLIFLYAYGLFSGMFAPLIYVDNAHDLRRTHVGIYPFYILLVAFCTLYACGWLRYGKYAPVALHKQLSDLVRNHLVRYFYTALSAMAITCLVLTLKAPTRFTSVSCIVSILNGNAREMREVMEYNFTRLEDPSIRDVKVKHVPMKSSMLTSDEIADWKHGAYSFYRKNSVEYIE